MSFEKLLPEWKAQGTEPPQELKEGGWKAGIKPPADHFNWLQNLTYEALKELQEKSETTTGSKDKADTAERNAKNYTDTAIEEAIEGIDVEVPVTSVNGQTGDVNLTAEDVGAETPQGAQQKVDTLAGEGNTKTVKEIDDSLATLSAETANEFLRQASSISRLTRHNTAQDREIAYLKLKQEAADRVDGGRVFAEDMNGNRIGMSLDEVNSHNIAIRDGKLVLAKVEVIEHDVLDATVTNEAYDTAGNGGRKLVRLENGWLVAAVKNIGVSSPNRQDTRIYVSKNNGDRWNYVAGWGFDDIDTNRKIDPSIVATGNKVHLIFSNTGAISYQCRDFDSDSWLNSSLTIDSGQQSGSVGSTTLTTNRDGTELHAAWTSKNNAFPNSFNIRYAKGVINADGSVTWGAVEQVTSENTNGINYTNPTIVISGSNQPIIISEFAASTIERIIYGWVFNGTSWLQKVIYSGGTHAQSSPSAIFVPSEINGLPQGRIWVAWQGRDGEDSDFNIRVSYSDNGGATWSSMQKLTSGSPHLHPTITANKRNKISIIFLSNPSSLVYNIQRLDNVDGVWAPKSLVTTTSIKSTSYPSTLFDLNIDYDLPLFVCRADTKVAFYGTWTETTETPELTATAVYDLPSTDYVGAFIKKLGAVNIEAYINDQLMDDEGVENDEYMFTKALDSEVPVKLRLELSRDSISGGEGDCVTRILGGIA